MKGGHQFADLKTLYASERGIALRTAQLHAKQGHPDWVAFTARTAGKALKVEQPTKGQAQAVLAREGQKGAEAPVVLNVAPPAMSKPEGERTVEEWAECESWCAFEQACEQRKQAMKHGDAMAAVAFVKIQTDALKAYHLARQKRLAADIEAGRLKPVAAWYAVKSAMSKIVGLLVNLEEIAAAANPDKPMVARKAIADWKHQRFSPAVEGLIAEVDGTIAAAA